MIAALISWVVFGMVAGLIARMLHPGPDAMGLGGTMMLGVIGSLVGGGIAYVMRLGMAPYEPAGWIMSVIGAILLLFFGFFGTRKTHATM